MSSYSDLKFTGHNMTGGSSSFFNKTLRKLSSFGQDWQDQVYRNTQLIGAYEDSSNPTALGSALS